ncbi:MAG TPA: hypothetical protein DGR97_10415 [Gammaproteobacteria bacterium]|nr:hypothetical protein [Gammaproteobacteria bacterium]
MFEQFDDELDLEPYPVLNHSRLFSRDIVRDISRALIELLGSHSEPVMTIAVAGSLGRLEASSESDIDCIIIIDDRIELDQVQVGLMVRKIRAELIKTSLRPSKAEGIYCRPVRTSCLLEPNARGSLTEEAAIFGTRMQLLLDARPIYNAREFNFLRGQLLAWYGYSKNRMTHYTHLLNDLSRYLHAYAVWQEFKFSRSKHDGWYLRQAKFRSTRVVTFAGLLFAIGEATASGYKTDLELELNRTPLGRIQSAFNSYPGVEFRAFIETYELLHRMLSDASIREELVRLSPISRDKVPVQYPGTYARIHDLSGELMEHLTEFILARRRDWPSQLFHSWLL